MLKIKVEKKLSLDEKVDLLQHGTNVDTLEIDKEQNIKARIDSGEITAANFSSLSLDEQSTAKVVLFKQYSPDLYDIPKALSCAEFLLVSLVKLLNKCIDKTKLDSQESAFFDAIVQTIDLNDMPINDTTDWRFQYLSSQFTQVQNNRAEYLQQKQNVTGSM